MPKLDALLETLRDPMLRTLSEWIRIPSVKAEGTPGAPFGPQLRRMLDRALEDSRALGLSVRNVDGYAGHADLGEGEDRDALAILVHLDVVPAGDGWSRDPFGGAVEGGRIYGRGASDDKGPAAAALYALHAVKQAGIPLRRKVRLIFGCDEESGWEDLAYYEKKVPLPRTGFSPDAGYPLINVEKGLCHLKLEAPLSREEGGPQVLAIHAGERPNVIAGTASALLKPFPDAEQRVREIAGRHGWPAETRSEDGGIRISTQGIPGHAAIPETARSAIGQLLVMLEELGVRGPLTLLARRVGMDVHGRGLGISVEDALSGKLTQNMGILRYGEGGLMASLDIRYPVFADIERVLKMIRLRLPGFEVSVTTLKPPHHVPEDSSLVKTLLDVYHRVTGRDGQAIAIGGGTYARALKEGVAFGAVFPDEEEVAHQADEYMNLQSLFLSLTIFARAIIALAGEAPDV